MNETVTVASDSLRKLAAGIANRTVANRQLAIKLEQEVFRQFDSEGKEFNTPWAPLKLSTIMRRLRKGGKKGRAKRVAAGKLYKAGASRTAVYNATGAGLFKILQDTGALRQSFAGFSNNNEAGVGARSNVAHADLALVHQHGDASRNIPARNMLPPNDMALTWALQVYQNYIAQQRKEVGL